MEYKSYTILLWIIFMLFTDILGENEENFILPPVSYSSERLHSLRDCSNNDISRLIQSELPKEMKRRKRGKRGDVKKELKSRRYTVFTFTYHGKRPVIAE